jgi:hypothetical protein
MGGWRKLYNDAIYNDKVIISRRIAWMGHGRDEKCIQNMVEKL